MAERPRHFEMEDVIKALKRMRERGFYGTLLLGMQNGEITQVEPKPVIKPGEPLELWMP